LIHLRQLKESLDRIGYKHVDISKDVKLREYFAGGTDVPATVDGRLQQFVRVPFRAHLTKEGGYVLRNDDLGVICHVFEHHREAGFFERGGRITNEEARLIQEAVSAFAAKFPRKVFPTHQAVDFTEVKRSFLFVFVHDKPEYTDRRINPHNN
jgi:hypothetical protein